MEVQESASRKVKLSADTVAAVAPFICQMETRYYLNGIYVEPRAEGGVIAVATDGRTMAICLDPDGEADRDWICRVPAPVLAAAGRRVKGKSAPKTVHFIGNVAHTLSEVDVDYDASVPGPLHLATAYAPPIDGTFPDWRAVVPKNAQNLDAAGVSFDPRFVASFAKAGAALGATGVTLLFGNGPTDPIGVRVGHAARFFGVIMPMRADGPPAKDSPMLPEWARAVSAPAAAAAE